MMGLTTSVISLYSQASSAITWRAAFTYSAIFFFTWLFYKMLIEPLLSPLRKISGAPFNPILGNMRRLLHGEAMESSIGFLKEYGTLYRYYFMFGRERIGVGDPGILKHILVTNAKNYIKPPSRLYLMKMILGNGLVMSEGVTHATHKRLMSPAFNNSAIKKMLPVFVTRGGKLADYWKSKLTDDTKPSEVDIHADLTRTTLDIIGDTAFGYDFNSLLQPDLPISRAFNRVISGSGMNWRFFIPYYYKFPFPEVKRMKAEVGLMYKTVSDIIKTKRQLLEDKSDSDFSGDVSRDVLGMMMMARDDQSGRHLSDTELRDQVMTLMFAGHETTAVAMTWCLLVLADHKNIQQRAFEEISSVFPEGDSTEINWENLEKLKYCDKVVKETLRMYPPVPLTLRQSVNDDTYRGKDFIPGGTIVLLTLGPMMRLPEMFEDPDTFNPDRFDCPQTENSFYKFLPFLVGSRMCLGHKFAVMEMKALLVVLLRQLVFERIEGTSYKRKLRTTMRPDPQLRLQVSHRKW